VPPSEISLDAHSRGWGAIDASGEFYTGKELHDAQRCHLNAAVFDFGWEREAGELLDSHPAAA
jgi:hypothetical protein